MCGCMNSIQAFSEFLNTLFQFQKELRNKLPALRGKERGQRSTKPSSLATPQIPTLLQGRLRSQCLCGSRLLMMATRLTLEDGATATEEAGGGIF